MRKRIRNLFLAFCLILSLLPYSVFALGTEAFIEQNENAAPSTVSTDAAVAKSTDISADLSASARDFETTDPVSGITVSVQGDTIRIDGSGPMTEAVCQIIDEIRDAQGENHSIKDVIISNGITSIEFEAFRDFCALETLTLGEGVTVIEGNAFYNCYSLTALEMPDSLELIDWGAFYGCDGLTTIVFSKSLYEISAQCFGGCSSLKKVTIPGNIWTIAYGAFSGCSELTEVILEEGVSSLDYYAFADSPKLEKVVMPPSVTYIESDCFSGSGYTVPRNLTIYGCSGTYAETYAQQNAIPFVSIDGNYYTVSFDANGGTDVPAAQTAEVEGTSLTLSSAQPTRASSYGSCTVTLNANGGSVTPASLTAEQLTIYTFKNWNTSISGNGTSYAPGANYTANASVTLYAQWDSSTITKAVELPVPIRNGYTFCGWATSNSADSGFTGSYTPTGNMELYAIWKQSSPATYVISYDANGGTDAPAPQTEVLGTALTLSSARPTREITSGYYTVTFDPNDGSPVTTEKAYYNDYYYFTEWNTSPDGSGTAYAPGVVYTAQADMTLYAQWRHVRENLSIYVPTPDIELGYVFRGWATSPTATSGVTMSYQATGDITLYAIWEEKNYTIEFNANGGEAAPAAQTYGHNLFPLLSQDVPTRASSHGNCTVTLNANGGSVSPTSLTAEQTTNYTFKNWNTSVDGTGTSYAPGDLYCMNENVTLYAQWNSSTTTAALELPTPVRTGYTFQGWAASSTAASGTTGSYTPAGNVTLYATWKPLTYTVNFDANGGTGAPAVQTKTLNVDLKLSSVSPTRSSSSAESYTVTLNANGGSVSPASLSAERTIHYTFKNWNTSASGNGTSYAPGANYTANANVTLYAQWNSSTTTAALELPTPVRTGYTFQGWAASSTAASGTTRSYTPAGNVTLYATWKPLTYTVNFDANGGAGAPAVQTKTHNVALTLSSVSPTHSSSSAESYTVTLNANGGNVSPASLSAERTIHYTFKNWNTSASGNGTSYASGANYTANANVTLYAQWNSSTTTAALELPTPVRTGYTFQGWAASSTAASGTTGSYTPAGNVTLYATWKPLTYTVNFDANGGVVYPDSKTVTYDSTYGELPGATRSGYRFDGWFTSATGGTQIQSNTVVDLTSNQTLYAHWTLIHYYKVSYNTNGGTGTPSTQSKEENVALTLTSITPTKNYIVQYNAAGGNVSPASKNVSCVFNNWNTDKDGKGISYSPGGSYTANADVTLYAQWTNPAVGILATPTRSGYVFDGWFTSATGGTQITQSSIISESMMIYAHWTDIYNMGDETYSFPNYGDSDSQGGHCFGMSVTSAAYHIGSLNISIIGGNANTQLNSFSSTAAVRRPICFYQGIQGWRSQAATVAGGTWYLYGVYNIAFDWQEVLSYVQDHSYDNTGLLQIGFRKKNAGGHAINFLRYEKVNGQDRIYAYDNNFPNQETYFYADSSGNIRQAPVQTFDGAIDCIALRDVRTYLSMVDSFDSTHVLYMEKDIAAVQGYTYSSMEGTLSGKEYVMYEIPADQESVIIIPSKDYADFIYMDTAYSFGEITADTRGELRFATLKEGAAADDAYFRVFEADSLGDPDLVLPSALTEIGESAFEGIAASIVYIPDTCVSIGSYAFRNASITKIRIPANCSIANTAFANCENVKIFGTPGSAAETYCTIHANCTFIPEAQ